MSAIGQILLIQPGGIKLPAKLDVFKHGPGIYLSIRADQAHIALVGTAETMAETLRRAADQIDQAVVMKDQGHISREEVTPASDTLVAPERKPVLADLNGDPRHDWPIFIRMFHGGAAAVDVLPAMAHLYKKQFQYSAPDIDAILEAEERLE